MQINAKMTSPPWRRALAAVVCVAAFMVMASVFTPDRSRAIPPEGVLPRAVEVSQPHHRLSADPHEGLQSLGVIEDRGYTIHIYATEGGPRYTIYENVTGSECGALMSEEQVHRVFPEIELPTMEMLRNRLMLIDPAQNEWR